MQNIPVFFSGYSIHIIMHDNIPEVRNTLKVEYFSIAVFHIFKGGKTYLKQSKSAITEPINHY